MKLWSFHFKEFSLILQLSKKWGIIAFIIQDSIWDKIILIFYNEFDTILDKENLLYIGLIMNFILEKFSVLCDI